MARVKTVSYADLIDPDWGTALRNDYISKTDATAQSIISALTLNGRSTIAVGYHRTNIIEKSGAYTATLDDDVIKGDTSGAPFTITLPAVATASGKILTFIRTGAGANALTIDGNAAETIDGAATNATMDAKYDSLTILCTGSEWVIIARKIA